ncbi:MAG: hypothetical protein ABS22_09010, partial [SAR92 bacterium BACL16 MAG-120322-bin99]
VQAKKRSYKDQRELDLLPAEIESLEIQIGEISEKMNNPEFYQAERALTAAVEDKLTALQTKLNQCYKRWEQLEAS